MSRTPSNVTIISPDDLLDDEWDRIMDADSAPQFAQPGIGHTVADADGIIWDVWEARITHHDFAIYLGRPHDSGGQGGAAVILTSDLCSYLGKHRSSPDLIDLPISRTCIKRLRCALGHNWYDDGEKWWTARLSDLESMTTSDFCAKHGVKPAAVTYARLNMIGTRQRPPRWWASPEIAHLILANQPRLYVSVMLDICQSTIGKYRTMLRKEAGTDMSKETVSQRISDAMIGRPAHPNTKSALLEAARRPKSQEWRDGQSERNRTRPRPASWVEREWTPSEDAILGTASDREAAEKLNRTIAAVRSRRHALRIPAFGGGAYQIPHGYKVTHARRNLDVDGPDRLCGACPLDLDGLAEVPVPPFVLPGLRARLGPLR